MRQRGLGPRAIGVLFPNYLKTTERSTVERRFRNLRLCRAEAAAHRPGSEKTRRCRILQIEFHRVDNLARTVFTQRYVKNAKITVCIIGEIDRLSISRPVGPSRITPDYPVRPLPGLEVKQH
jgi:hypothetical protein